MAFRLQTNNNGIYTKDYYIIGSPVITTSGEVIVAASIPTINNKGYLVNVNFSCSDNNTLVTNAFAGIVKGAFRRLGGNVSIVGTAIKETFTGFGGGTPALDLIANTINNTIDIRISGRTSVPLNWIIEFTVDYKSS